MLAIALITTLALMVSAQTSDNKQYAPQVVRAVNTITNSVAEKLSKKLAEQQFIQEDEFVPKSSKKHSNGNEKISHQKRHYYGGMYGPGMYGPGMGGWGWGGSMYGDHDWDDMPYGMGMWGPRYWKRSEDGASSHLNKRSTEKDAFDSAMKTVSLMIDVYFIELFLNSL